jgi:hypothetical protein
MKLLASGKTNAKTSKNKRDTAIMYIAPYNQNDKGVNLCPKASKGCAAACLYNSGRGKFNNVKQARVNKANYFVSDKKAFTKQLLGELVKLNNKGKYDYTKVLTRVKRYAGTNYRLTFSMNEDNQSEIEEALSYGAAVSVVFSTKKGESLPTEYLGYKVIDGDMADDLMLDERGAFILGLRFKGNNADRIEAVKSGFVLEVKESKLELTK